MPVSADQKKALELVADIAVTIIGGIIVHAAAVAAWGAPKGAELSDQILTMPNLITLAAMYGIWKLARHYELVKVKVG